MTASTRFRNNHGWSVILGAVFAALALAACSSKNGGTSVRSSQGAPVSVAKAVAKDMPLQIKVIGYIQAYSFVQLKAQVSGPLSGVSFREGQDVKKGDVLFKIDPRPFEIALRQEEAVLAKDRAQLKNANDEVARFTDLAGKEYVTKERYDQIRVNADVLKATVQADEAAVANARLQLDYCTITSPIDGRTGSLMVYPGNLIRASDTTPLVVIYQIRPIYAAFSVPEQNLSLIRAYKDKGELKAEAFLPDKNISIPGVLAFIDNGIDTNTGMVLLKAAFPNADQALWPGQYVNMILTLTVEKNVVVVPAPAVQAGQSGSFVLIVKADQTVESRPVTVERTVGDESVIGAGLKAGETVITDGHLRAVPGGRVEIKKAL
ncbi:MAG: efflux RND transporter periplasmic adaptor subunit [Candidatus Aminicenantales bacterium]